MRFDNIFISKGTGTGWTLNFENPVSWIIVVALIATITFAMAPQLKKLYCYLKFR